MWRKYNNGSRRAGGRVERPRSLTASEIMTRMRRVLREFAPVKRVLHFLNSKRVPQIFDCKRVLLDRHSGSSLILHSGSSFLNCKRVLRSDPANGFSDRNPSCRISDLKSEMAGSGHRSLHSAFDPHPALSPAQRCRPTFIQQIPNYARDNHELRSNIFVNIITLERHRVMKTL